MLLEKLKGMFFLEQHRRSNTDDRYKFALQDVNVLCKCQQKVLLKSNKAKAGRELRDDQIQPSHLQMRKLRLRKKNSH